MRYRTQSTEQVNNLMKNYVVKIVPVLNPDGVVHGNYRRLFSGHDLNRKWKKPSP